VTVTRYVEIVCDRCGASSGRSEEPLKQFRERLGWIRRLTGERYTYRTYADYCKGCIPFVHRAAVKVQGRRDDQGERRHGSLDRT
jgi:hypothetical protein